MRLIKLELIRLTSILIGEALQPSSLQKLPAAFLKNGFLLDGLKDQMKPGCQEMLQAFSEVIVRGTRRVKDLHYLDFYI